MHQSLNFNSTQFCNKLVLILSSLSLLLISQNLPALETATPAVTKTEIKSTKFSRKPNSNSVDSNFNNKIIETYEEYENIENNFINFAIKNSKKLNLDKAQFIKEINSYLEKFNSIQVKIEKLESQFSNQNQSVSDSIEANTVIYNLLAFEPIKEILKITNNPNTQLKNENCNKELNNNIDNFQNELLNREFTKDPNTTYKAIEKVIKELCK